MGMGSGRRGIAAALLAALGALASAEELKITKLDREVRWNAAEGRTRPVPCELAQP